MLVGFIPEDMLDEVTLRVKAEETFIACHPDDYDADEFKKTFVSAIAKGRQTREHPSINSRA